MANDVGISIGLDLDNVRRDAGVLKSILGGTMDVIKTSLGVAGGLLVSNVVGNLAAIGKGAIQTGIEFNAMKEQTQTAFATMLGDADKAKTVIADIQKLSAETPLEFLDLANAGKLLTAFNVSADQLVPTLKRIGDVSSGIGANVGEIAELYGKAKVQGRLFAEDINQFQGRGIPILTELGKQLGVSEAEVKKLVEGGKIGFPQLEKAFVAMTSKGGKFYDMMKAQSKTFNGLLSTVKDNFAQTSAKVMEPLFALAKDGLQWIADFTSTDTFGKWVDDAAAGVQNFVSTGLVPFLKNAANTIQKDLIPAGRSVVNIIRMLASGDFQGGIFGLQEDDPWITALLDGRNVVKSIVEWVGKLAGAIGRGDWGAAWETLVSGLSNVGGLIEGKLEEGIQGARNWLKDHGPETWAELTAWASTFWNWLVGQPDGAVWQAGGKVNEVAAAIAAAAKKEWDATIAPALADWSTKAWDWLTGKGGAMDQVSQKMVDFTTALNDWAHGEDASKRIHEIGAVIGGVLNEGLGAFFGTAKGAASTDNALRRFLLALGTSVTNIQGVLVELGGEIGETIVSGIFESLTGKAFTPEFKEAIRRFFQLFVGGHPDLFAPLTPPAIAPVAPGAPFALGSGGVQNVAMTTGGAGVLVQIKLGEKELTDFTQTVVYTTTEGLFKDATAQVLQTS